MIFALEKTPEAPTSTSTNVQSSVLNSNVPDGPLADKWTKYKGDMKIVSPANKRKYTVIVVGTGLAGASARVMP